MVMVSQRLAQGFQIILRPRLAQLVYSKDQPHEKDAEVWLSIGRIYHYMKYKAQSGEISVKILRPLDKVDQLQQNEYSYLFQVSKIFDIFCVSFMLEVQAKKEGFLSDA